MADSYNCSNCGKKLGSILRASILKTLCAFVLICNANDLFSQASETYNWGVTYGHKIFNEFPEADGLNTLSVLFLKHPGPNVANRLSGFASRFEGALIWESNLSGMLVSLLAGYEWGKANRWSVFIGAGGGYNELTFKVSGDDKKSGEYFFAIGGDISITINDRVSAIICLMDDILNEPTFIFDEAAIDVDLSGFRFSVGLVLNPD